MESSTSVGGWGSETVNSFMLKPGPYKWEELEWGDLLAWYSGVLPEMDSQRALSRAAPGMFAYSPRPSARRGWSAPHPSHTHSFLMISRRMTRSTSSPGA